MPDYKDTVEKLRTAAAAFATGETRIKPITRDAANATAQLCLDALALLTEQDAELARLRAENARWRKARTTEIDCPCTDYHVAPYCPIHGG